MIFEDFGLSVYRFEVDAIINYNRETIICTNDLFLATTWYENTVQRLCTNDTKDHIIVLLYDYDKNCNINYYDNFGEIT